MIDLSKVALSRAVVIGLREYCNGAARRIGHARELVESSAADRDLRVSYRI